MVFSSPVFLFLFLPLVLGLYFLLPRVAHNAVLLAASLLFYSWGEPRFVVVMLASVAANYLLGLLVERCHTGRMGQLVMAFAIVINIGLLGFYKYANFFVATLNQALHALLPGAAPLVVGVIELPLGISFFTFHALSYVIDIYRRDAVAQRHPLRIALYVSFFPQLVAGPIVRYHEIADQLTDRSPSAVKFARGVERFVVGLGKKMLIANALAVPADTVFALPATQLTTPLAWIGVACYALQIYFDFSGYSDMAIGLASMFGFKFPENFNYPYISQSLTEFWRRWHLSLSNWFRDYLYVPLGGNRRGPLRTYLNLVTVFFLCGLWHGASWSFVVWGLFHGAFLVIERMGLGAVLKRAPAALRHLYVVLLFLVGWVFFRAATLDSAWVMLRAMAGGGVPISTEGLLLNQEQGLALVLGVLGSMPWLPALLRRADGARAAFAWPLASVRASAVAVLLVLCAMRLSAGTYNPFIYFRF